MLLALGSSQERKAAIGERLCGRDEDAGVGTIPWQRRREAPRSLAQRGSKCSSPDLCPRDLERRSHGTSTFCGCRSAAFTKRSSQRFLTANSAGWGRCSSHHGGDRLNGAEAAERIPLHLSRVIERACDRLEPKQGVDIGPARAGQLVDVIVSATAANEPSAEKLVDPVGVLRGVQQATGRADRVDS